jgi:hypothetical protein
MGAAAATAEAWRAQQSATTTGRSRWHTRRNSSDSFPRARDLAEDPPGPGAASQHSHARLVPATRQQNCCVKVMPASAPPAPARAATQRVTPHTRPALLSCCFLQDA